MNTKTYISESDRDGGLLVNVTEIIGGPDDITLEISDPSGANKVSVVIFTMDRVGFLELLRRVVDECLLRVRDEEQTGERDDG